MDPLDNIEKLIKDKGVQFRDFRFSAIEEKKEDGTNQLVIEGVPATFEQPTVIYEYDGIQYFEVIDRNAFTGANMTDVIFNYNHSGRVYSRTRNNTLTLSVGNDGLHMRAVLRNDDIGHQQLYADIKSGLIDRMSFAFTVATESYEAATRTRRILSINRLYDVSAVDIPAYDTTTISARSFFDLEREKELKEIQERDNEINLAKARYFYF